MVPTFFERLGEVQRLWLLNGSTTKTLADGEYLFHQGDRAKCVYLIQTGRVAVTVETARGERLIVRAPGPGEIVGELAVLLPETFRSAAACALQSSTVSVIHRDRFVQAQSQWPEFDRALACDLAMRLAELTQRMVVTQFGTVGQRLAERLLELDEITQHSTIAVTQESLSAMVGGVRQTVNRALCAAERAKLVELHRGGVRVLDRPGLVQFFQFQ